MQNRPHENGRKSSEHLILSVLARPLEGKICRNHQIHPKSAGGFAVNSLSDA